MVLDYRMSRSLNWHQSNDNEIKRCNLDASTDDRNVFNEIMEMKKSIDHRKLGGWVNLKI